MSADEKKYFRRFGLKDNSKGRSYTEILFDIIDEANEFNEEKILFRLKREKGDTQAAHIKNYLFDLLLDTLVWYNKERLQGFDAAFEMAKIRMLEDRGLDDEAVSISEQAIDKAFARGSFTEKWSALSKSIYYASNEFLSDKREDFKSVSHHVDARAQLVGQMERYHRYDAILATQLSAMRKAMVARNSEDIEVLNRVFENELVQNVQLADSPDARFVFHTVRLHHFQVFNLPQEFLRESEELIAFIKANPQHAFPLMRVLWAYAQVTQACYYNGLWQKLEGYLAQLNAVEVHNQTERIAQFTYFAQLAITLFDYKGDEPMLRQTLSQTVTSLNEFKDRLRPDIRLAITITCVSAFVEYGDYEKALALSEDFLTNYDSGVRLDALLMLYVYEFICHLETGNMVYVNNTIQNVYRYFLRNEYNGPFENTLMKLFRKISEAGEVAIPGEQWERFKADLDEAVKNSAGSRHLALLPIVQNFIEARQQLLKMHEYARLKRTGS